MKQTLVQLWRAVVGRLWSRLKDSQALLTLKQFYELARKAFRKVVARLQASGPSARGGRKNGNAVRPEEIQAVVEQRWELRYNELDNNVELRPAAEPGADFVPLNERLHNTLVMEVQNRMPLCYRSWVDCYLFSTHVPAYHPLRHYVEHLPAWDGHDYVGDVARQVSADAQWEWVFRRWLRAMVSGWTGGSGERCVFQNQLAPLLVSERQGLGKSTFCRSLLPPVLRRFYLDKFDINAESHAEKRLGTMALISMDEFDRYSERQMGTLKNLMQLTEVTLRRPHGRSSFVQPRTASLIGTSNFSELLTDPSGSRRFYCQPVTQYVGPVRVPHDQLYAQVAAEIAAGEPVHFSKEEEAEIERHNAHFYRESPLEEAFARHFTPAPDPASAETLWLSAGEIFEILKTCSPKALQGITIVRMGRMLRRLGVTRRHDVSGNRYAVVRLNPGEPGLAPEVKL